MSNSSRLYRYQVIAVNGTSLRMVLVKADVDAESLSLGGQVNVEASAIATQITFRIVLAGRGGPKSKVSHARTVTVVMTSPAPPLSVGSRAVIPVFRIDRWSSYQVGQVGTYMGGGCRCVDKRDGLPNVFGGVD